MVLGDLSLWKLLNDLIRDPDPDLVNPASIDIRVGLEMRLEVGPDQWKTVDLTAGAAILLPGDLVRVPTLEWVMVPNGYAVELRLADPYGSQGYELSAAPWLEPGWCGTPILSLRNATRHTPLPVEREMRIAQLVVHQLDQPAVRPHRGRREQRSAR
jgi:deoxycytidine triphosphate deaminase